MKLLDLFSGIGGFSLAFKRVFPEGEIIGHSEIDKYANIIYEKHFPGVKQYGDIRTISERDLPKFNIVSFGFPCQDLSIAGKRTGFDGRRSSLFHEAIRIIDRVRPEYFVFENVKGLFSSRKGKDFITVLSAIADIGYNGQWQLCNTKWFLPQNRERIYFVGHLRGQARPEIFPIGENDFGFNGKEEQFPRQVQTENDIANCLTSCMHNMAVTDNYINYINDISVLAMIEGKSHEQNRRVYDKKGICPTLNGIGNGGNHEPKIFDNKGLDCSPKIRRLTPLECERLQGFPDGWTEGVSDTQRYKCLGNAISVPVPETIFKKLRDNL